jgi:hypothetical protein
LTKLHKNIENRAVYPSLGGEEEPSVVGPGYGGIRQIPEAVEGTVKAKLNSTKQLLALKHF